MGARREGGATRGGGVSRTVGRPSRTVDDPGGTAARATVGTVNTCVAASPTRRPGCLDLSRRASMKGMDVFEQMAALRREGQSFVLPPVVARRAPVSAHLGDRAIVFADGRMEGFGGGACSREIVRRQAL